MSAPYGGSPGPYYQHHQQSYGPPSAHYPQTHAPKGYAQRPPIPHPFQGQTAGWGLRFVGYLIDGFIASVLSLVAYGIGVLVWFANGETDTEAMVVTISITGAAAGLLNLGFGLWNFCYLRGTTGQTIGQKVAKIKTISEETGLPLGFGGAFLRQLCHFVDGIACGIGWLAPLWDEKNQTFADKIVKSLVVRAQPPRQW